MRKFFSCIEDMKSEILAEDESILVCFKPAGLAVQSGRVGEADMVSELKKYLAAREISSHGRESHGKEPYLGLIHRLDQPVSGLLVFAKTPEAAAKLSRQAAGKAEEGGGGPEKKGRNVRGAAENRNAASASAPRHKASFMEKEYTALVYVERAEDLPEEGKKRTLVHYLKKDNGQNLSRVAEKGMPGAKRAELEFHVLGPVGLSEETGHVPVRIRLMTGRHHQIRVQCAASGMPLLGDNRYGSPESRAYSARLGIDSVCLCASRLCFSHPVTGERLEYTVEELPWKI